MKSLSTISIAALALCAMQAMAADGTDTSNATSATNAAMTQGAVGAQPTGSSDSGAGVGKTRAEVYQELIRARQDGTLDKLNALYGGG